MNCKICNEHPTDNGERACDDCKMMKEQLLMFHQNGATREEAWDKTYTGIYLPYRFGVRMWDYTWETNTIEHADTGQTAILKLLDREQAADVAKDIRAGMKVRAIRTVRNSASVSLRSAWTFVNTWIFKHNMTKSEYEQAAKDFLKSWAKANKETQDAE